MARRFDFYRTDRGNNLGDPEHWNKRFEDLDLRLHARELDGGKIDEAVDKLTNVALQRLNDTFTPVVEEALQRLADVGAVFTAESVTEVTIEAGTKNFVLTEGTRASFVLTDYVSARPVGLSDRGMVCSVVSFDRTTGLLVVEPVEGHIIGTGTYSAWTIRVTASPDIEHASRNDNPHAVTAAQVGAYTIAEADSAIETAIDELKGGASAALDTLGELAEALGDDEDFAATVTDALGNRLRVDAAQSLTTDQKTQAQNNLGFFEALAVYIANFFWSTGDYKLTGKTVADPGWLMLADGTIGSAASGATYQNADAQALFALYFGYSDAVCPITTSAGSATTRAAQTDAATAWANNCRIATPKVLGRAAAIAGHGSGLTNRAIGSVLGEEAHTPALVEMVTHAHGINNGPAGGGYVAPTDGSLSTNSNDPRSVSLSTETAGSSLPFNVMQPTAFAFNIMVKK